MHTWYISRRKNNNDYSSREVWCDENEKASLRQSIITTRQLVKDSLCHKSHFEIRHFAKKALLCQKRLVSQMAESLITAIFGAFSSRLWWARTSVTNFSFFSWPSDTFLAMWRVLDENLSLVKNFHRNFFVSKINNRLNKINYRLKIFIDKFFEHFWWKILQFKESKGKNFLKSIGEF